MTKVSNWFDEQPAALLNLEHGGMFDGDRILQFPHMILAPGVAKQRPWLSAVAPRLVVYTRWTYFMRSMRNGLFSTSPSIVIGNRRVESNYDGIDFISSTTHDLSAFAGIRIPKPVTPVFAKPFTIMANEWMDDDEDDL